MRWFAMLVAVALISGVSAPAQNGASTGLPDAEPFFAEVRDNLSRSQRLQNRYAYKERRTELHTNPFGKIGTGGTVVYDVVPSPDGATLTRRVIERDGKPVVNAPTEQREAPRRERAPTGRSFDDVVSTLQFRLERREYDDRGRPMIVVSFSARPDAKPRTRQGRMARSFAGNVWVDENLKEVVRVEATAVDNLSMGFGFVARLNEGTKVSLLRRSVVDGLWLPTEIRFTGHGRALLFRKLNVDYAIEWFDYRAVEGTVDSRQ